MNPTNIFHVPSDYKSIQEAINAARDKGHKQNNPAIVSVTPNASEAYTVNGVQFREDITLYDGIYLMSSVPKKKVNINGTFTLGSTTYGGAYSVFYIIQDMYFIADGGGTAIFYTDKNVPTHLYMTRVDIKNTGMHPGDTCVNIDSTAKYDVILDECFWICAPENAPTTDYCLNVSGAEHTVTICNRCNFSTFSKTVTSVFVDDGTRMYAYDSKFDGLINVGATAATYLDMYRCSIHGPKGGYIVFGADNYSMINVEYTTFNGTNRLFVTAGDKNIIYGANCSAEFPIAIALGPVSTRSSWIGNPVVMSDGKPKNAIDGMLWADKKTGAISIVTG